MALTAARPAEEYADLPAWIRPGAQLAALIYRDNYTPVTVKKITATQIVTVSDRNTVHEYRFERAARSRYGDSPGYHGRGQSGTRLVERTHPDVITVEIKNQASAALSATEDAAKKFRNPGMHNDKRVIDERVLELLDSIENAARAARKRVLELLGAADN